MSALPIADTTDKRRIGRVRTLRRVYACLVDRYWIGKTNREIATILELPERTVAMMTEYLHDEGWIYIHGHRNRHRVYRPSGISA